MIKILLFGFLFYVVYKFVFGLVIPVYRTTKKVKQQFTHMHQKVQEQFNQHMPNATATPQKAATNSNKKDYIDFEEVQ